MRHTAQEIARPWDRLCALCDEIAWRAGLCRQHAPMENAAGRPLAWDYLQRDIAQMFEGLSGGIDLEEILRMYAISEGPKVRRCRDCEADISDSPARVIRCPPHQARANAEHQRQAHARAAGRRKRRTSGLCQDCGRAAAWGAKRCAECAAEANRRSINESKRRARAAKRQARKCETCGTGIGDLGQRARRCGPCQEQHRRESARAAYDAKRMSFMPGKVAP